MIVTAGGGAVGETLLRAALAARPLSRLADRVWRLITGPNLPDRVFEDIAWHRPPGVIIERWRDDLPALFRNCRLVDRAGRLQYGHGYPDNRRARRRRAVFYPK